MLTGTDLYTILQGVVPAGRPRGDGQGAGESRRSGLIWLAGVVFLLGALITIWPDPREARQLARRYAEALAARGVSDAAIAVGVALLVAIAVAVRRLAVRHRPPAVRPSRC